MTEKKFYGIPKHDHAMEPVTHITIKDGTGREVTLAIEGCTTPMCAVKGVGFDRQPNPDDWLFWRRAIDASGSLIQLWMQRDHFNEEPNLSEFPEGGAMIKEDDNDC